jgi:hypothetical protein
MDLARIVALPCWRGPVSPQRLPGGITNVNQVVEDAGERFVVRLDGDIPVHQVMRFNELTPPFESYGRMDERAGGAADADVRDRRGDPDIPASDL